RHLCPHLNTFLTFYFLALLYARHTSSRSRDRGPVHAPRGEGSAPTSLTKPRSLPDAALAMRPIEVASAITARRAMKRDLYAEATARIVAELEAGCVRVYYGAADGVIALADLSLQQILAGL